MHRLRTFILFLLFYSYLLHVAEFISDVLFCFLYVRRMGEYEKNPIEHWLLCYI